MSKADFENSVYMCLTRTGQIDRVQLFSKLNDSKDIQLLQHRWLADQSCGGRQAI